MSDKPTTVRVRIAVAINCRGRWNAAGWTGNDDAAKRETALEFLDEQNPAEVEAVHWIEADVPVPQIESQTLAGTVTAEPGGPT